MVQIQVSPIENLVAILAGALVALEHVVPREFDLFFRETVEDHQHDHLGHPDARLHGVDHLDVGFVRREVFPCLEIVSEKIISRVIVDHMGMALEQ